MFPPTADRYHGNLSGLQPAMQTVADIVGIGEAVLANAGLRAVHRGGEGSFLGLFGGRVLLGA